MQSSKAPIYSNSLNMDLVRNISKSFDHLHCEKKLKPKDGEEVIGTKTNTLVL